MSREPEGGQERPLSETPPQSGSEEGRYGQGGYGERTGSEGGRIGTIRLSLLRMEAAVSATDLLFGLALGLYFGFYQAIEITFAYSAVVAAVSILMGYIGSRERTSFGLASRWAFGSRGSWLPAAVMAIFVTGFYGFVLGITVDAFPKHTEYIALSLCVVLGLIYLFISGLGFSRGMRWVGRLGVPLMLALVAAADYLAIGASGGLSAIEDAAPRFAGAIPLLTMIGLGISEWTVRSTSSPDVLRSAKDNRAGVVSAVAELMIGNLGFNILGLVLGLSLGTSDLGSGFQIIGISSLAVLAIFIQSLTVEMNALYAASLTLTNLSRLRRALSNVVVGAAGIVVGFVVLSQGLVSSFLTFVGYAGYALPEISGIIIADYFVVRRMEYPVGLGWLRDVSWRGVAAYFISLLIALCLGLGLNDVFWRSTPAVSFLAYLLLSIPLLRRRRERGAPEPLRESERPIPARRGRG